MPRLLVINPNTTTSITGLVAGHVRATVGKDIELVTATGRFGCAYVASEACYAIAAHAALECFAEGKEGCDAVLLACFGDHGLFALREVSPVPVVGLAEASMRAAAERGADEVILGGAGLAGLAERIAPRVWVPVLDSVLVGARRAAALARTRGGAQSIGLGDPL